MYTWKRLTNVYNSSEELLVSNKTKIVIFSDCHRGDNSTADHFAKNHNTYYRAIDNYFEKGFIYIEAGDGDELWGCRKFSEIREANADIFRLLKKYHEKKRLFLIFGNHDMVKKNRSYRNRNLRKYYNSRAKRSEPLFEDIKVHEGLILKFTNTPCKAFIVHGHQGDLFNDRLWPITRFLVRYIVRTIDLIGLPNPVNPAYRTKRKIAIQNNIQSWLAQNEFLLISGHTHKPTFPTSGDLPYFNCGSCVEYGGITCIEIENHSISLVKWYNEKSPTESNIPEVRKQLISGPQKVTSFLTNTII